MTKRTVRRLRYVIAVGLLTSWPAAAAEPTSFANARELRHNCGVYLDHQGDWLIGEEVELSDAVACMTFFNGAYAAALNFEVMRVELGAPGLICVPDTTRVSDLIHQWVAAMDKHPDMLDATPGASITAVMVTHWPCGTK